MWTIATSKRNYVSKLWVNIRFLWFLSWNIVYKFGVKLFINLLIKQPCSIIQLRYYFLSPIPSCNKNRKKRMLITNLLALFRLLVTIVHTRYFKNIYFYSYTSTLFTIKIFSHWPSLRSDPVACSYFGASYFIKVDYRYDITDHETLIVGCLK